MCFEEFSLQRSLAASSFSGWEGRTTAECSNIMKIRDQYHTVSQDPVSTIGAL